MNARKLMAFVGTAAIVVFSCAVATVANGAYVNHGGVADPLVIDAASVEVINANTIIGANMTLNPGPALVGADATAADFPMSKGIFSTFDSTVTFAGPLAAVGEVKAGATAGLDGAGLAGGAISQDAQDGYGVYGIAFASATGDTGNVIGGRFQTTGPHAGGTSAAVKAECDATGSTCFSFWGTTGIMHNVERIQTDAVFDVDRTQTGDGSVDIDLLRLKDGATVVCKIWFDHSDSYLESSCTFFAPSVRATNVNATNIYGTKFQPFTSGLDLIGHLRSDVKDIIFEDKDSYALMSIEPTTGAQSLHGSTDATGSILLKDGATLYGTVDLNGDTLQIAAAISPNVTEVVGDLAVSGAVVADDGATVSTQDAVNLLHTSDQPGIVSYDFTGNCADGETLGLTKGATVVDFEFDTGGGPTCTTSPTVCIDVSGGVSDVQCATALAAGLNGASVTDFDGHAENATVVVTSTAANVNYSAREAGGNLNLSSATATDESPAQQTHVFHCEHTISANEATALGGASGATGVCGTDDEQPIFWQCNAVDSSGENVSLSNTSFHEAQAGSGNWVIIAKDGGGGADLSSTDVVKCFIISHH